MIKLCIVGNCGHGLATIDPDLFTNVEYSGYCPGMKDDKLIGPKNKFAQLNLTPVLFDNYIEMIETVHPDILVVDSIFCDHYKITKYALQRGINVYCEKPLAFTTQECIELQQLAEKLKVLLWAMQTMRYDPWMYTAKKMLEQNCVGKIRMINAQKSYKFGTRPPFYCDRNQYGGTIPWVAVHGIDLIQYFSGKKFTSVFARQSSACNQDHGTLETTAVCCFTMEDDILAHVNADLCRPGNAPTHGDDRIRIVGTQGVLEVRGEEVYLIDNQNDGTVPVKQLTPPRIFEDYLLALEQRQTGLLDMQQSVSATYVALLARESADTGKVVEINY